MKKVFTILLLLFPLITGAQELAHFVLMPDGTYKTEDGNDFVVIPFEGKTAHQIFQELASNVGSTFNNPSKVMSTVEDVSIKIRAYSSDIIFGMPFGYAKAQPYGGYYQLEFKIRDGRVRVSAPFVEDELEMFDYQNKRSVHFFRTTVKKLYKNGELLEKKKKYYDYAVNKMNSTINQILYTSTIQDTTEDW